MHVRHMPRGLCSQRAHDCHSANLSSEGWWMSGESDLFSRHNWIYLTDSGTADQTERSSDKMVKITRLKQLVMQF